MSNTYCIAFDGSEYAQAALRYAAAHLHGNSKIVLVGCYPSFTASAANRDFVPFAGKDKTDPSSDEALKEMKRRKLMVQRGLAAGKHMLLKIDGQPFAEANVSFKSVCVEGHVGDAIIGVATSLGAHGIICGTRGFGGAKKQKLGSISSYLAEHATVPVTVCHKGDKAGITSPRGSYAIDEMQDAESASE